MFKLISGLLIGIFSASLAVIYQNDIAALLGRAPITVEVVPGGWYPHFQTLDERGRFTEEDTKHIGKFTDSAEINFARFTIKNNTGRENTMRSLKLVTNLGRASTQSS